MPSIFNIVRTSIYAASIAWTLVVLGLAMHLDQMLIANDLTRFIPLAIFVSVCTLLIIPTLLIFGFIRRPFPIQQVRVELIFVGLLGLLWFILGIYTASEPDASVECDFDGDGDWEESDEFSTDTFHAQIHTIEAFAIFNAILLFVFFFLLLLMSLRQHFRGRYDVWRSGTTSFPWFSSSEDDQDQPQMSTKGKGKGLPPPVTAKVVTGTFGGGKDLNNSTTTPMKAGGHYIIYIPPPPPPARS